jgi:flavin-dependent dehydrogenase
MTTEVAIDERDSEILARRAGLVASRIEPQSGDWVIFADGVERRVSHVWDWPADSDGPRVYSIQTSDGGSWYLGDGYASFSGGLHPGVSGDTFSDTGTTRPGGVWIFHHDYHTAHNGVDVEIDFRVWRTTEAAN